MALFTGIDLHSDDGYYGIVDETGRRVFKRRLPNRLPEIIEKLEPFSPPFVERDRAVAPVGHSPAANALSPIRRHPLPAIDRLCPPITHPITHVPRLPPSAHYLADPLPPKSSCGPVSPGCAGRRFGSGRPPPSPSGRSALRMWSSVWTVFLSCPT